MHIYVFMFQPILCSAMLTMYHRTSMRTHVCINMCAQCHVCRCARIMQIHIPMIAEVKMFQRLNMLYVHHMHTLVCRVFKWNYEQLLYGKTFLPTDIRFARANAPLNLWYYSLCEEVRYTVNMAIFAGGKFHENVGKTFHEWVICTILLLFPS